MPNRRSIGLKGSARLPMMLVESMLTSSTDGLRCGDGTIRTITESMQCASTNGRVEDKRWIEGR